MKVVIFSAVAVLAVVGITLAQDFNNNFNNFNDDDEGRGFWGGSVGGISSGLSSGMSSWGGASWGGMSGGWGGAGVGAGVGTGFGSGMGGVSYVPLPARGGSGSSGILGALLPLLFLFLILPNLLSTQAPNLVIVNRTTG